MEEKRKYEKRKKEFLDIEIPDLLKMVESVTNEIDILKKSVEGQTFFEGSPELVEYTKKLDDLIYKRQRLYRRLRKLGHGLRSKKGEVPPQPT